MSLDHFYLHVRLHLDARAGLLFTQAADQRPAVAGDVRHVGDRLHLLWIPDAHLQRDVPSVACRHRGGDSPVPRIH